MTYRLVSRQAGFSMIEVLVAVLVLSVGLLGMAALMASSMRNNQSANFRTPATNLAYDYIDMMRANFWSAESYAIGSYSNPSVCAASRAPTDFAACSSQSGCDKAAWTRNLCYVLPNGRGRAVVTRRSTAAVGFDVVVDVCWIDDRSLDVTVSCPTLTDDQEATCSGGVCVMRVRSGL